jgi:hypothetical protein
MTTTSFASVGFRGSMWNVGPPAVIAALTLQIQFNLEWMLLAGALVGLILLGGLVIVRFKRWQAEQQAPPPPTRIEDYRALMEQGLLDPREFERIRDHLENKVRPDSPPAAPPPADPPVK